ncbi:MAG: tetratricopeptide repeat protein [Armatimonadota bacterium]
MRQMALVILALMLAGASVAQDRSYHDLMVGAREQIRAQQFDDAEATLGEAITKARSDDERAAAIFTLAAMLESRGEHEAAREVLKRALELEGGGDWLVRCLDRLGALSERLREHASAQRAWERMIEVLGEDAPQAGGILLDLARLARGSGELDRAADYLNAVLEDEAHAAWHDRAREALSEVHLTQGQFDRALGNARKIDDTSDRRRLEMRIAEGARSAGRLAQAEEIAWGILTDAPDYVPAMRLVYEAAAGQGAVEELRRGLQDEAEGDGPEDALRFLAEIARWEDDSAASVAHFERLAQLRPKDAGVRVKLGEAALRADELEKAEAALREAVRLAADDRSALTRLAEVLVEKGATDEAVAALKRAVNYDPGESATVHSLNHALKRHSLHHERARIIEEAREATDDPRLMAYEMARAQIDLLRYEEAARELLLALGDDGVPARAIAAELERLVADELAGEDVLAAVRDYVDDSAHRSAPERLALGRVLLTAGDHERAASLLEGTPGAGMAVADLAREAQMRHEDKLAATLYEMALTMEIRPEEVADVTLNLARLQRDAGDWRAALETLEDASVLDADPDALLLRAHLLTRHARRLDEARDAWDRLTALAGGDSRYAVAAREGMADWLFASGRFDEAEQAYAELAGEPAHGPSAQSWDELPPLPPGLVLPGAVALPRALEHDASPPGRAALRLAEIALRRGDLEEAEQRFRHVADAHGETAWANDALERLAFIRENLDGSGSAERRYFEALGLLERGEDRMARDLLLEIAGTRDEPLADDALMALAEFRAAQGELQSAAEAWVSVAERFPESLRAPGALLRAGGVLRDLGDFASAGEALRRILEDFPDSAAAHEASAELELLPSPPS